MRSPEMNRPLSKEEYDGMRARFHDDEQNYSLLRGDVQGVREQSGVWDTDYVLEQYVRSTDKLIGIMDGSIGDRTIVDARNPEQSAEKPDAVIFLDKSARPVSWFTDALWEQFAKDGVQKPEYEFLNIDRVNWFVKQGHDPISAERRLGPQDFDIDKVSDEEVARIRALFIEGELDRDTWRDQVWDMPTRFDGKNILIVDETPNKGGTLFMATEILKRALPETTVSGQYFMQSGLYAFGGDANEMKREYVPVWYDAKSDKGRGIGEVNVKYYEHRDDIEQTDDSFKKRIGAFALSAPHFDPDTYELRPPSYDKKALRLQQDIAYLTYGVGDGKVLRQPDKERAEGGMDEYLQILQDQGLTLRQFSKYNDRRKSNPNDPPKDPGKSTKRAA